MVLLIAGCSLAPSYHTPSLNIPKNYKEDGTWLQTAPYDKLAFMPQWWKIYQDPTLNQLQEHLTISNQNLKIMLARYEGAIAQHNIARSELHPFLVANGDSARQKNSNTISNPSGKPLYNDRLIATDFIYEIDLWQRIRNNVHANKYQMQASLTDIKAAELNLRTLLITNYFLLQAADQSLYVLNDLTLAYQKALDLTNNRFKEGIATIADVSQAQAQLENAKTLYTDKKLNRALYEHAIAILIGETPSLFSLASSKQSTLIPIIGSDLPSTLLQRRPDIVSAEKAVMAANAKIGVAKAAFFPSFNLLGEAGYESASFRKLFNAQSLIWSLGPTVMQTLYDGGNIKGRLELAKADYRETVANYRQTVLNAFREVEDSLASQNLLEKESVTQEAALKAASEALQQANYRYEGGIATFLDVVVSQNVALQTKLASIDLLSRRQIASVQLIKALGGPW